MLIINSKNGEPAITKPGSPFCNYSMILNSLFDFPFNKRLHRLIIGKAETVI